MIPAEFKDYLEQTFLKNNLSHYLTPKLCEQFYQLSVQMMQTGAVMNLTALRDEKQIITRHFADCLLAAPYLPEGPCRLLDVGSGSGMPALPFALVRPDISVTALDSTAKKTAYIAQAARNLELSNLQVLTGRAEELGTDPAYRETFDVVCARAVAELRILLEWCIPFLKTGGIFIALKGKNAKEEQKAAENAFSKLSCILAKERNICLYEPNRPDEKIERNIFIIQKMASTDKKYPRRNAQITKKPL